ncbi:hypothetical protein SRABI106_04157 [Rahnella aquatilis]|nr:hypothetical protein SRABI106_04157 [Rahnella aquatilis]
MVFSAGDMPGLEQVTQHNQLFALRNGVVIRRIQALFRQTDMLLRLIAGHAGEGLRQHILAFGIQQRVQQAGRGLRRIIFDFQTAEKTGAADGLALGGVGGKKDIRRA